jgi:hypothetical protein
MAFVTSVKPWGIACSINTGTAADNVVVAKGTNIKVGALICGGAATTDIITVKDGAENTVWQGAALVGKSDSIVFPKGQMLDGILVGFAGATTGWCNIIYGD